MYIYIYIYYRTGAGIRPLILHVDFHQKPGGGGVYPISHGYKHTHTHPTKNTSNTTSIYFRNDKEKHIYSFALQTATIFSGRLPAQAQKFKTVAAILYASVGNEFVGKRNFYTQNRGQINSHRTFYKLNTRYYKESCKVYVAPIICFFSMFIMSHLLQTIILLL